MRIIYISHLPFADCDFPLIRAMQKENKDVIYLIPVNIHQKQSPLFSIKELYPKSGIFPASIYKEFDAYCDYIDLNRVYIINSVNKRSLHPSNLLLFCKVFKFLKSTAPDIIHITFVPISLWFILYLFRKKLALTLHDPFLHSGKSTFRKELCRRIAFKLIHRIIILNKTQLKEFCKYYKYPTEYVTLSSLGSYDCMNLYNSSASLIQGEYILFFGYISIYKGVEHLLEAFQVVQQSYPNLKLVIAGAGQLYFPEHLYKDNPNIIIINRFITMEELSVLLKKCLFSVCPYNDATQSGVVQTAFSMSTPLIVTDVGALSEAVKDYETGLVVQPHSPQKLSEAILYLLDNPHLLAQMRNNIETKWKPSMSWDLRVQDYFSCYKKIY